MEIYLDTTNKINEEKLIPIAHGIKNGKIAIFPTETVYGIGTNGLNALAVKKIYEIKKRDRKNPINLLVSNKKMIQDITKDISPLEHKLMEAFFPGPFTIILKRKTIIPDIVTANSNLVGIRMPNNKITQKLIQLANVPIAAPSANISGKLSRTNLKNLFEDFSDHLDFVINDGQCKIGIESPIVRVINDIPHILRPGFITPNQIQKIAGNVILEEPKNNILPSSDLKHYQLDTKSILVFSENNSLMVNKILNLNLNVNNAVIVCCLENVQFYTQTIAIKQIIPVASRNDLIAYSKNLFSALQKASSIAPDIIFLEGVKKEGIGIAIMNRLQNICNNNSIIL